MVGLKDLTGKPHISLEHLWFPVDLPTNPFASQRSCQGIPGMGGGFAKQGPPWRKTTEKVFNEAPGNCFGILWVMFPGVYTDVYGVL